MQFVKHFIVVVLVAVFLSIITGGTYGCNSCSEYKWGYNPGTFNRYNIQSVMITAKGVKYDPSGLNISPQLVDRLTDEVDLCLQKNNFPGVKRGTFVLKVASDFVMSCGSTDSASYGGLQQQLPIEAPFAGCAAKGQTYDPKCPCRWRAGIKCPNILISPPNFYLYKDVLIRYTLGIQNPWSSQVLATCAAPSTDPLSNGQ